MLGIVHHYDVDPDPDPSINQIRLKASDHCGSWFPIWDPHAFESFGLQANFKGTLTRNFFLFFPRCIATRSCYFSFFKAILNI